MSQCPDAVLTSPWRRDTPVADLEALTDRAHLPEWVSRWCARRKIRLHTHRLPHHMPPWAPLPLLNLLDQLPDRMILIDRGNAVRPDTPRVVAAIDELPEDQNVLAAAIECATELGAVVELGHAVPLSFGERSVGLDEALARGHALLDRAAAIAATHAPWLEVTARQSRTHPQELVGSGLDADLLVLGRPRCPGRAGHGLVALSALIDGTCPLLLVPDTRAD